MNKKISFAKSLGLILGVAGLWVTGCSKGVDSNSEDLYSYDPAKLHLVPLTSGGYHLDADLIYQLREIKNALKKPELKLSISKSEYDEKDFFDQEVFNEKVEYRLATQPPAECIFTPSDGMPLGMPQVPAGCTKGNVTYLLPREFAKLDILRKAFLIIHQRMQAYTINQPVPIYTGIINGLSVYMNRFYPAYMAKDENLVLSPGERGHLNEFRMRIKLLTGAEDKDALQFTENGGVLTSENDTGIALRGNNIRIYAGSVIRAREGGTISGSDISMRRTSINASSLQITGDQFEVIDFSSSVDRLLFYKGTTLKNFSITGSPKQLAFGPNFTSVTLDGDGLNYEVPRDQEIQIAFQDDLMKYRTCKTYHECHNKCPPMREWDAGFSPVQPNPSAGTATTTTGLVFTRVTERPELGEAWMDPCGFVWGDLVKSAPGYDFDEKSTINYFSGSHYCYSMGARLPDELDFQQLLEFFGAKPLEHFGQVPVSNEGYTPQVLPNLSGYKFWADFVIRPYNDEIRYFYDGATGAKDQANPFDPGWGNTYRHSVRCVRR